MHVPSFLLASLGLAVPAAHAQLAFAEPQSLTQNTVVTPYATVLADFDGDGDPDLVASSASGAGLTWHENIDGAFADEVRLDHQEGLPRVMEAVDFDADGDLDLVVAHTSVGWLENDGTGAFATYAPLTDGARPIQTHHVADLDVDGALDLLVTEATGTVVWYRRQSDGSLAAPAVVDDSGELLDATGIDVDKDGDLDIAVGREQEVRWYRSDGLGGFAGPILLSRVPRRLGRIEAEDLDGDGDHDLVYANESQDYVGWFEHLGGASFGDLQVISSSTARDRDFLLLDLDDDGRKDVVTATISPSQVRWSRNLGGSFAEPIAFPGTVLPFSFTLQAVAAADVDGDGATDVLVGSDRVRWFSGGAAPRFSDDTLITPDLPGADDPVVADLNGDGANDIAVLAPTHGRLAWLRGTGDGTFGRLRVIADDDDPPLHLVAGDVDVDGDLDLVTAHASGRLRVRFNGGDGEFSDPIALTGRPTTIEDLRLVDFDGDGDLDVVVAALQFGSVSYFENQGGGAFAPRQTLVHNGGTNAILLPDLDADGDPDLLVSWWDEERLFRYLNQTDPGPLSQRVSLGPGRFLALASADLDADGDLDVIATSRTAGVGVSWFANDGSGRFTEGQQIENLLHQDELLVQDLDLDGDADVYTEQRTWVNNGTGQFELDPVRCAVGSDSGTSAFGDLDGDGAGDLISAAYNQVAICLNQAPATGFEEAPDAPSVFLSLAPNPARGATTIRLASPAGSEPLVTIHDALGREVAALAVAPGEREIAWEAPSPGIYLVRLSTEAGRVVRRLSVVR